MRKQKKAIERFIFPLFLLVVLCTGPNLFSQEMEADTIGIEKTEFEPGEDIRINYRCAEANLPNLWIGVFNRDVNEAMMQNTGLSIKILGELNASVLLNAPDTLGNYQVCLFSNQSGEVSVHHRLDIEVKEKGNTNELPGSNQENLAGEEKQTLPVGNLSAKDGLTQKETPPGVYEDFAFVKTGNPKMQLLAVHKNGSMMGYRLADDLERVEAVVFKKDESSPGFVMTFDENGIPRGAGGGDNVIVFKKLEGERYKSQIYDNTGKCIKETEIEIPSAPGPIEHVVGPNAGGFPSPGPRVALKSMNWWVQHASFSIDVLMCAEAAFFGPLAAALPCSSALVSGILTFVPKEDNFLYDELVVAKEMLSFASIAKLGKKLLGKLALKEFLPIIVREMSRSIDTIDGLVDKYSSPPGLGDPKPFVEPDKKEYTRKKGLATVVIKYGNIYSSKDKRLVLYRIDSDNKASFFMDRVLRNRRHLTDSEGKGKLKFNIPFNGKYEVRVLYDNEIKIGKIYFSVVGDDEPSPSKFSDSNCLEVQFAGSIYIKSYYRNKVDKPIASHFSIEFGSCTDSRITPHGRRKPLEIVWSGNTFYATSTRMMGLDTVVYYINGRISPDGNTLEYIKMDSVAGHDFFNNLGYSKETKQVVLENIPYNEGQRKFVVYSSPETLKDIKFLSRTIHTKTPKDNYTTEYVEKDGYKTRRKNSFIFKLGF